MVTESRKMYREEQIIDPSLFRDIGCDQKDKGFEEELESKIQSVLTKHYFIRTICIGKILNQYTEIYLGTEIENIFGEKFQFQKI